MIEKLPDRVQKVKEAREHYLGSTYGRFDLLAELIPNEVLLNKPRIVMRHLCRVLSIEPSQVSYPAFAAWLRRYKKSKSANHPLGPTALTGNNTEVRENIFDFQPTDPFAKPTPEPPLIKIL